jgi:rubrerythrin
MDFTKAKEILDVIEKLDPNSKDTIMEALKLAEHVETVSEQFYEKEVKRTKGTELEAFFAFMVKEEEMHLEKIKELEDKLQEEEFEKIDFPRNVAPEIHNIPAGRDDMTSILFALWREKKAVEFYSGASEKTSGNVKAFFKELADFEKTHVALLEEMVEGMQNVNELIMG